MHGPRGGLEVTRECCAGYPFPAVVRSRWRWMTRGRASSERGLDAQRAVCIRRASVALAPRRKATGTEPRSGPGARNRSRPRPGRRCRTRRPVQQRAPDLVERDDPQIRRRRYPVALVERMPDPPLRRTGRHAEISQRDVVDAYAPRGPHTLARVDAGRRVGCQRPVLSAASDRAASSTSSASVVAPRSVTLPSRRSRAVRSTRS